MRESVRLKRQVRRERILLVTVGSGERRTLRRSAKEVTQYATGNEKPSPAEAWEMAMTCVRRIGIYGKWDLPDEVATAVKYFGKEELCMLEMDAVNTARSQFMKMYQSIVDRNEKKKENEDVLQVLGESRVQKLIRGIGNIKQIGDGKHEQMG